MNAQSTLNLRVFSREIPFPAVAKPKWADSVSRWHQMDAASFALVQAYEEERAALQAPSFIILASPTASNEADCAFVRSGALSPAKMIYTLPSARSSPLCQAMDWFGPILCLQKDPATQIAGLIEGFALTATDYPVVWVVGVHRASSVREAYKVTFFEMSAQNGEKGGYILARENSATDFSPGTDPGLNQWFSTPALQREGFRLAPDLIVRKADS